MKERVCRDGDEKIYQPKIHSENIRELFRIGRETGLPITVLVDYAIRRYIANYEETKQKNELLRDEVEWGWEHRNDEKAEEPEADDLTDYLEPYQNNPYGENY
jgi:hypothetical protein